LLLALHTGSFAYGAHFFGDFTTALTGWAYTSLLNIAKNSTSSRDNLPGSLTGITILKVMTWFCGGTLAMLTGIIKCQFELSLGAKNSLFEAEF
jgi:hypothetical protein